MPGNCGVVVVPHALEGGSGSSVLFLLEPWSPGVTTPMSQADGGGVALSYSKSANTHVSYYILRLYVFMFRQCFSEQILQSLCTHMQCSVLISVAFNYVSCSCVNKGKGGG